MSLFLGRQSEDRANTSDTSPIGLPRCPSAQSLGNLDARISGLVLPAERSEQEDGQIPSDNDDFERQLLQNELPDDHEADRDDSQMDVDNEQS